MDFLAFRLKLWAVMLNSWNVITAHPAQVSWHQVRGLIPCIICGLVLWRTSWECSTLSGIRRGCWRVYDVQISTSQWRSRSHNSRAGFCINFKLTLSLFVDILETEKDLKKKSSQQNKDCCIIIKPTGLSCGPSFVSRKKKQKKEQKKKQSEGVEIAEASC